jgi:acetolactate synthase small subunit
MIMSSLTAAVAKPALPDTTVFSVHACAEPGVMPRVLELFAKRGLVPCFWHSTVVGPEQARLAIEIRMSGCGPEITEHIAASLRQIASVEAVLTSRRDSGN